MKSELSETNKRRIATLADYIENSDKIVFMRNVFSKRNAPGEIPENAKYYTEDSCGTVCCLLGHLYGLRCGTNYGGETFDYRMMWAQTWLQLNKEQSVNLFMPMGFSDYDIPEATQKKRALEVLRGQRPLDSNWLISA